VSFQLRENAIGPELGVTGTAPELQMPLGPPLGQFIAYVVAPAFIVSEVVGQLNAAPPELVNVIWAHS
jgi:hypothetical protein